MEIQYCYNKATEETLPITKEKSNVNYYLNLLKRGYSYEELFLKLQELFLYHYDISGHEKYLEGILSQREYLHMANEKYLNKTLKRTIRKK